jgi:hypothetical protein
MESLDKDRIMRDLGKLFYGKNEEKFSLEKFLQSINKAPVIKDRLIGRSADE